MYFLEKINLFGKNVQTLENLEEKRKFMGILHPHDKMKYLGGYILHHNSEEILQDM